MKKLLSLMLLFVVALLTMQVASAVIVQTAWQNQQTTPEINNGESITFDSVISGDKPISGSIKIFGSNGFNNNFGTIESLGSGYEVITKPYTISNVNYNGPGTYTVLIDATDGMGSGDSQVLIFVVKGVQNQAPVSVIEADKTTISVNGKVIFNGLKSTDDKQVVSYTWSFGDGKTSILANPENVYATAGSYKVELTVKDAEGLTNTASVQIQVNPVSGNQAPKALYTAKDNALVNEQVTFDASSSTDDGTIVKYQWLFNVGVVKEGKTATYAYSTAGEYTPSLTVTDNNGSTNTFQKKIVISNKIEDLTGVDFDVIETSKEVNVLSEQTAEFKINVNNKGIVDINSFNVIESNTELEVSYVSGLVKIGETSEVTLKVKSLNTADLGKQTFDVNLSLGSKKDGFSLSVNVLPNLCDVALEPKIVISIKDPDNGDDVKPGDTIDIEVDVRNNFGKDLDIEVTAELWNVKSGDELTSTSSNEEAVDSGDRETFELSLEIPNSEDVDESEDLVLFIKAEDSSACNIASVNLDVKREAHDVIVDDFVITPSRVSAGQDVTFRVTANNAGTKEEDDVEIRIKSSELGIELMQGPFTMEEFDKNDNEITRTFTFNLNEDIDNGNYEIIAEVVFNNGKGSHSVTKMLTITDVGTATKLSPSVLSFFESQALEASSEVDDGEELTAQTGASDLLLVIVLVLGILLMVFLIGYAIVRLNKK